MGSPPRVRLLTRAGRHKRVAISYYRVFLILQSRPKALGKTVDVEIERIVVTVRDLPELVRCIRGNVDRFTSSNDPLFSSQRSLD
jgi:hypothetical protein